MLVQEHFAAAPLPAQVVREIHVAHDVRLFKADAVAVFVITHGWPLLPARTETANCVGSSRNWTIAVAILKPEAASETHPCFSWEQESKTRGASSGASAFLRDSSAVHTRVAAV